MLDQNWNFLHKIRRFWSKILNYRLNYSKCGRAKPRFDILQKILLKYQMFQISKLIIHSKLDRNQSKLTVCIGWLVLGLKNSHKNYKILQSNFKTAVICVKTQRSFRLTCSGSFCFADMLISCSFVWILTSHSIEFFGKKHNTRDPSFINEIREGMQIFDILSLHYTQTQKINQNFKIDYRRFYPLLEFQKQFFNGLFFLKIQDLWLAQ